MLYIVRFLHQTTTISSTVRTLYRCISSVSYIKPQPTLASRFFTSSLYIVRFLHQTTTCSCASLLDDGCISSVSYIKPQPFSEIMIRSLCCISSVSYIKPQHPVDRTRRGLVVYRPFPTSNHNRRLLDLLGYGLYIVRFLHQTTTLAY